MLQTRNRPCIRCVWNWGWLRTIAYLSHNRETFNRWDGFILIKSVTFWPLTQHQAVKVWAAAKHALTAKIWASLRRAVQSKEFFSKAHNPDVISVAVIKHHDQSNFERVYFSLNFQVTVHHLREAKAATKATVSHIHSQEQRDQCTMLPARWPTHSHRPGPSWNKNKPLN